MLVGHEPDFTDVIAALTDLMTREPKPEAPKPAAPADQLRLSKTEPSKPAAPGSRAAREDDAASQNRALSEAQSRQQELERNVADLQKLLALKNQQLAEMEKKGAAKPAPAPVPPVAQAPAKPEPAKPAAEAPKPAPTPAPASTPPKPEPAKPAAEAPKPAAEAAKPAAPKPAAKKAAPPPEPSLIDEFTENPLYLGALGGVVILLIAYFWWAYRRKKNAQARFQDSVLGAAAAGGAASTLGAATSPPSGTTTTVSQQGAVSQAPAGMEAEEVDPIAEADVYMAYGRDAQAEEILKEALQKDAKRSSVHAKLLEIYAHRKDTKAFEQTALKLKGITNGAGPEWEKAAALGRSVDPGNGLYAGAGGAEVSVPAAAAAAATSAPTLDFDLGGASQAQTSAPDITLDDPRDSTATGVDIELGTTQTLKQPAISSDETFIASSQEKSLGSMDFNLDLGNEEKQPEAPQAAPKGEEASGGLDFDLNLDSDRKAEPAAEPSKIDLSSISLDLGGDSSDATVLASKPGSDPKWQEVATKLDLAKAYEEMGDKDGARELLKEVMKDGDAAQRGSAEQLLAKLG
jgi:pilus assembly protein FimV